MRKDHEIQESGPSLATRKSRWRRFLRSKDGAAAIEFAILAIPYFLIVFAILETFIAFIGEQLVANAVDTMARKMRTGNITYNMSRSTDMTKVQFRQAFCDEISIMIKCSAEEVQTPNKLLLDVRSFTKFADIPTTLTLNSSGDLDTASMAYTPGTQNSINMLRAFYRWQVLTDQLRPLLSTIKPTNGSDSYFLIVETSAFRNEDYP